MGRPILAVLSNKDGNDQVRYRHEEATPKKQRTPPESVDRPYAGTDTNELPISGHHLCQSS